MYYILNIYSTNYKLYLIIYIESRKRWIEDIEEDIQIMGIRG